MKYMQVSGTATIMSTTCATFAMPIHFAHFVDCLPEGSMKSASIAARSAFAIGHAKIPIGAHSTNPTHAIVKSNCARCGFNSCVGGVCVML